MRESKSLLFVGRDLDGGPDLVDGSPRLKQKVWVATDSFLDGGLAFRTAVQF